MVTIERTHPSGLRLVWVSPFTTRTPDTPDDAIELPPDVKRRLGLDDRQSWVITTELNRFTWPGFDLRRAPSGAWVYGRQAAARGGAGAARADRRAPAPEASSTGLSRRLTRGMTSGPGSWIDVGAPAASPIALLANYCLAFFDDEGDRAWRRELAMRDAELVRVMIGIRDEPRARSEP